MSKSLIIRKSDLLDKEGLPLWSLDIRVADMAETNYYNIAHLSWEMAHDVIDCGAPTWLYGEPDWQEHINEVKRNKARKLREEADRLDPPVLR